MINIFIMNPGMTKMSNFERFKDQLFNFIGMKRILGVLLVTAMIASSCGISKAKSDQGNASGTAVAGQVAEQPQTAGKGSDAAVQETGGALPLDAATDTVAPRGGTLLLTKSVFLQKVWDYEKSPQQWVYLGSRPAIIDFYADWCGPCKIAAPILEEISHEFAGKVDVYKIDTQKEQELAAVFGIRGIPAFLYIPASGKPTMTSGIARSKEETKAMFVDNIKQILKVEL
jgi:thioredoxin